MRILTVIGLVAAFAGCGSDDNQPSANESSGVAQRVDLAATLGSTASVVGVTVEPSTGRRYVLDAAQGMFRLDGTTLTRVWDAATTRYGVYPRSSFTDLVALGDNRFALTARGEGYELNLEADTLTLFFCYVPGDLPDEWDQNTESVAFDPEMDFLFAQPQSFDGTGAVVMSQIGIFDRSTGTPFDWLSIADANFIAGGMTRRNGETVLGAGSQLYRYDLQSGVEPTQDLAPLGVQSISGLAYDAARRELLVVDAADQELVELR